MPITAVRNGSDTLLLQVRGDFTRQGLSLAKWCRSNGVDHAHAHRVLRGLTNGERAQTLRAVLIAASVAA